MLLKIKQKIFKLTTQNRKGGTATWLKDWVWIDRWAWHRKVAVPRVRPGVRKDRLRTGLTDAWWWSWCDYHFVSCRIHSRTLLFKSFTFRIHLPAWLGEGVKIFLNLVYGSSVGVCLRLPPASFEEDFYSLNESDVVIFCGVGQRGILTNLLNNENLRLHWSSDDELF